MILFDEDNMPKKIGELTEHLREKEELLRQEIEKRKAAEEALRTTKEKFKQVMKEMPVILFATDEDGSIIFYNREFTRISGYTAREIVGTPKTLRLLFPDDNSTKQDENELLREWKFRSKDGSEKIVAWSNIFRSFPILGWKTWKVGVDITELKNTIDKVKTLSGLLPICANCKNIRDDKGYWNQIEAYIRDHSEAEFSHSICPKCAKNLYPDFDIYDNED